MKKMKLFLAVLLAVLLLAGCGSTSSKSVSGTVTESKTEPENASGSVGPAEKPADVSGNVAPTETEAPAETEEPAVQETAVPMVEDEEVEFGIGTQTGGVYENSFLGIGCALDDNWSIASEEELLELAGIVADGVSDEELADTLRNSNLVYDLYAMADDGLVSINVVMEKLSVLNGAILDEDSYAELSMDGLSDAMVSMGVYDAKITKEVISFAGKDRTAVRVSGNIEDTEASIYETIVCIKQGSYMACVTLCSVLEDITDTLASYFYAV